MFFVPFKKQLQKKGPFCYKICKAFRRHFQFGFLLPSFSFHFHFAPTRKSFLPPPSSPLPPFPLEDFIVSLPHFCQSALHRGGVTFAQSPRAGFGKSKIVHLCGPPFSFRRRRRHFKETFQHKRRKEKKPFVILDPRIHLIRARKPDTPWLLGWEVVFCRRFRPIYLSPPPFPLSGGAFCH